MDVKRLSWPNWKVNYCGYPIAPNQEAKDLPRQRVLLNVLYMFMSIWNIRYSIVYYTSQLILIRLTSRTLSPLLFEETTSYYEIAFGSCGI